MYKQQNSYIVPILLFAGLWLLYLLITKMGILPAAVFAAVPALLLGAAGVLRKYYFFILYFILNYLIMGINRYISLKSGVVMLAFSFGILALLIVRSVLERQEWQRSKTFLLGAWLIWFLYCLLELFNTRALWMPWSIAFPNYAFYPVFCAIAVPLLFTRFKHFQWLLVVWASLTMLAVFKGYWQKNHGFDSTELAWLLYGGGGKTHLIHSGIRFFSFFSDAAAYGASMGISAVVLGISGFYTRKRWIKILFWTSAISAGYGLIISGTRSDLAIPFVGLGVFLVLCRNIKAILITGTLLACAFVFLNYTHIGDSNRYIHRMRTVFDSNDASWLVRKYNRQIIWKAVQDKPFGVGLGLSGRKAERFRPVLQHEPLTYVSTDSWYVLMLVETGYVGVLIYLTVLIAILLKAIYISAFKIRNRELQGQLYAIIAGISGILVTCYANEVLNYPNGIIVYTLMAFLFIAPYYDQELRKNESES